jgi:hypothetical protein
MTTCSRTVDPLCPFGFRYSNTSLVRLFPYLDAFSGPGTVLGPSKFLRWTSKVRKVLSPELNWLKTSPTVSNDSLKYAFLSSVYHISHSFQEKEKERMDLEADRRWRVGTRYIRMEDLILVSLHHISKGSWQPQLRLRTPLSEIHLRRLQPQAPQSIA